MADENTDLMAHLMRRAGFGAAREELETRVAKGYEATVEELLCPNNREPNKRYEILRYHPWAWSPGTPRGMGAAQWFYAMISTARPLDEKIALFWHSVFAVGVSKVDHYGELTDMISTFRTKGMGNYRELLLEMARNPAMIYWLDNHENHADSVNENWGRELLELFSMGVDNYTEADVRECARAFTGWTIAHHLPRFPLTRFQWEFEYREFDHDDGEKTFLGETGRLNGEDIIRIICEQPATSRFIARHLYSFFVADEPQVPAWSVTPPNNPKAVQAIADVLIESDYHIGTALKFILTSDFFKQAVFSKVKNPTEVVIGTLRLVGNTERPSPETMGWAMDITNMGQDLLNPPSVEGWHSGIEWINSGTLMKRTNFTAELISDQSRPGVADLTNRVLSAGNSPEALVDACLDVMGPLEIDSDTRLELIEHAKSLEDSGQSKNGAQRENGISNISEILQLIVSLREFQFA